ncbi:hypothetical protein [Dongshaea marina]|uniref:hypothetical protein n=1 Tax=Dongshaea marina TaxID=2047966 RepID=UPI000D3E22A1|nr:hypothetical protein [Dongshaea marina]
MIKYLVICITVFMSFNAISKINYEIPIRLNKKEVKINSSNKRSSVVIEDIKEELKKDDELFIHKRINFICSTNICLEISNKVQSWLISLGKDKSDININRINPKFGDGYDMAIEIFSYRVLDPDCRSISILNLSQNNSGCTQEYLRYKSINNYENSIKTQ